MNIRIGQGIDFHRLEKGRDLWLGGVKIPSEKGCIAHSDGDVLIHALCDAIFGAAGLNDIGYHFPDTDQEFRNIDSKILLERTMTIIRQRGFTVINADCTVCLEKPRIAPYIAEMRTCLSRLLEIPEESVSVKATTTEKLGFAGRGEGVFAIASALLNKQ